MERHRRQDVLDLLEVVEDFVNEEWSLPKTVHQRMLGVARELPDSLFDKLPAKPWDIRRVRAALELLSATPDSPVERKLSRAHPDKARVRYDDPFAPPIRVWFRQP